MWLGVGIHTGVGGVRAEEVAAAAAVVVGLGFGGLSAKDGVEQGGLGLGVVGAGGWGSAPFPPHRYQAQPSLRKGARAPH